MNATLKKWLQISIASLLIVSAIGIVLRYKIAFSLPFVDQKNLLHGHSHFAFAGWVTQALMALLVNYLFENGQVEAFKKYRFLLIANLVTAYGMLISFPVVGYSFISILFSTLSIFVSYAFAIQFWRDLNRLNKNTTSSWFKAAIFFNAISSLGAFSLAYMLATHHFNERFYLGSIYFFLHFQYNGWFYFACLGLFNNRISQLGLTSGALRNVFRFFFYASIPAYFLSAPWIPIPSWAYWIVVLAAVTQLTGWSQLVKLLADNKEVFKKNIGLFSFRVFILVGIALTIKLLLQALSVIPPLSQLAFGFRPIVVGYLHLVLLGVISLFIINYIVTYTTSRNKTLQLGLQVFIFGIVLNEGLLMIQGVGDLYYLPTPSINLYLFIVAPIIFLGILLLNLGLRNSKYERTHNV
jgi:hypothetical protein